MTLTMQLSEVAVPSPSIARPGPVPVGEPSASELEEAVSACSFALVVWDTPDGLIRVANRAAAKLFDLPLSAVPGRRMVDLFAPRDKVEDVIAAFSSNAVEVTRTDRHVRTSQGDLRNVRVWSRTIELADTRVVVSLFVPSNETARLDRDPGAPWRDLAPIAVGFTDDFWRVEGVSRDVEAIVHTGSEHIIGGSLLNLFHPDDAAELLGNDGRVPSEAMAHGQIRVRDGEGNWVEGCLLTAPVGAEGSARYAFALIGPSAPGFGVAEDRVADLERRLRQIGAEVRAAGLLDEIRSMPRRDEFPQLAQQRRGSGKCSSGCYEVTESPPWQGISSSARAPCAITSRRSSRSSACIRRPSSWCCFGEQSGRVDRVVQNPNDSRTRIVVMRPWATTLLTIRTLFTPLGTP